MARIYSTAPAWTGTIGSGGVPDASITTIPLSSATGLTDGAYYILSIDRVDASGTKTPAKWEVVAGQLSGTNLINCIRGVEGTAQAHSAGATVEVLFTSYHWEQLKEYLETEHNPDGTHKNKLTTINYSATVTFDISVSTNYIVTLQGNPTLSVVNVPNGGVFIISLKQDAIGSRTVTWWDGILWVDGTAPTLTTTPNKIDTFGFIYNGENYLGYIIGQNL